MELSEKKILSFLKRAKVVSENSPDIETKVGSVLISKDTFSVVSEGYNGFVRGAVDRKLPNTRPEKYEYILHAEQNLISNAARNGVRTNNTFIVSTISPCVKCARLLYQAGIDTVYYEGWYRGTDEVKKLGDLLLKITPFEGYSKLVIGPNKEYDGN